MPANAQRTIRLQLALSATDAKALDYLAETLGLDKSNTIRLLIHERQRQLRRESSAASAPAGASKRKAS